MVDFDSMIADAIRCQTGKMLSPFAMLLFPQRHARIHGKSMNEDIHNLYACMPVLYKKTVTFQSSVHT
jgi:hypothetical protein